MSRRGLILESPLNFISATNVVKHINKNIIHGVLHDMNNIFS